MVRKLGVVSKVGQKSYRTVQMLIVNKIKIIYMVG